MNSVLSRNVIPVIILGKQEPASIFRDTPVPGPHCSLVRATIYSLLVPPGPDGVFGLRNDAFSVDTPLVVKGWTQTWKHKLHFIYLYLYKYIFIIYNKYTPISIFYFLNFFLEYNCFTMFVSAVQRSESLYVCLCVCVCVYTHLPSVLNLLPTAPIPPLRVITEHWAKLLC